MFTTCSRFLLYRDVEGPMSKASENALTGRSQDPEEHNAEVLLLFVQAVVPSLIRDLSERGGPRDWQSAAARNEYTDVIASESDALFRCDREHGKTARVASTLFKSLALLAFGPGGVTFAGIDFEETTVCPRATDGEHSEPLGE